MLLLFALVLRNLLLLVTLRLLSLLFTLLRTVVVRARFAAIDTARRGCVCMSSSPSLALALSLSLFLVAL
jgi:hypothetical protein